MNDSIKNILRKILNAKNSKATSSGDVTTTTEIKHYLNLLTHIKKEEISQLDLLEQEMEQQSVEDLVLEAEKYEEMELDEIDDALLNTWMQQAKTENQKNKIRSPLEKVEQNPHNEGKTPSLLINNKIRRRRFLIRAAAVLFMGLFMFFLRIDYQDSKKSSVFATQYSKKELSDLPEYKSTGFTLESSPQSSELSPKEKGLIAYGKGNWLESIEHLEPLPNNDYWSKDESIYYCLIVSYLKAGQFWEAEQLCQAVVNQPEDFEALFRKEIKEIQSNIQPSILF